MTLLSVIMPVRDESRNVLHAAKSVLGQSISDLELLIIDGESSDDTMRWLQQLTAGDQRVRILTNPRHTIPHALNVGLAAAQGRYVARVDGHATVNDTYLEIGVAALEADPQVAAVGGKRIGVARTDWGVAVASALSSKFGVGDSINHYASSPQDTDHASFGIFRTDVLRALGGWDENLMVNEDVDIDHRILQAGYRIRFDPGMCIYWQVREDLRDFAHQYRRYGRGKAAMVRKNGPAAVRIRHLAPPALVGALALAGGALLARKWSVAAALAGPYLAAVGVAAAYTARTSPGVQPPTDTAPLGDNTGLVPAQPTQPSAENLPAPGKKAGIAKLAACFVAMHTSWGVGFAEGLIGGLPPASSSGRPRRGMVKTHPQPSDVTASS